MCDSDAHGREHERQHRTDVSRQNWLQVQSAYGSIEYAKKKDKRSTIKVQKDEMVRGDATYKSSTIHVGSGEPPNSGKRLSCRAGRVLMVVSSPMPPRNPKKKKAPKAAPAGMAVSF